MIYPYNTSVTRREYQERVHYYTKLPKYCEKNVMYQPGRPETLTHMGCNRLSCPRCRPKVKHRVLDKLVEVAGERHLQRHLVLTCPGWVREGMGPDASFKWLNAKFRSFKVLYERETGQKLHYIKLPRSHKNGYCHLHVLVNTYIKKSLIEDLVERVGMGPQFKISYQDLHRLNNYLKNEFSKEHEWFIPVGMRHMSASMEWKDGSRTSIFIMWDPSSGEWVSIVFGPMIPPHVKYDFVYDIMCNRGDGPPPYWWFQFCFLEMLHVLDNKDNPRFGKMQPNDPVIPPAGSYQLRLDGRRYKVTSDFEQPRYTNQKKYEVTVWKK